MGWLKKCGITVAVWMIFSSTLVLATEEVRKSSVTPSDNEYIQAFYAAIATLMVLTLLWIIIFRPKFKSSHE
ncbi:MAG TPA: hypothetical protein DEA52_01565 [Clostridiaceae bacterium]|nr:hypothetical protein [Clostridiaceae bacterium]